MVWVREGNGILDLRSEGCFLKVEEGLELRKELVFRSWISYEIDSSLEVFEGV